MSYPFPLTKQLSMENSVIWSCV